MILLRNRAKFSTSMITHKKTLVENNKAFCICLWHMFSLYLYQALSIKKVGHSFVLLNMCPIFFPWYHSTYSNKICWSSHHRFKCLRTYALLHGLKLWGVALHITKRCMLFGTRNTSSTLPEFFIATHFPTRIGNQAWWYIFFIVAHDNNTSFQVYPSHQYAWSMSILSHFLCYLIIMFYVLYRC